MSLFDPQQRWPERMLMVFGFVGIAVVAFDAGWPVGTLLKQWHWVAASATSAPAGNGQRQPFPVPCAIV
jgi:hypothetical protein